MADSQPKKELTEAEQYAAEEKARTEALAQKEEADKAAEAKAKADAGAKADAAKKAASKAASSRSGASRSRPPAKPKVRVEVYEQRGPAGLYRVTRNIDNGKVEAELIEPAKKD